MKQLLSYLKIPYNNLTYQKKLLFSYLILVFIPLFILSVFFYAQTTKTVKGHTENLSALHLEYTTNIVSDTFSEMLGLAKTISLSDTIQEILAKEPSDSLVEYSVDLKNIESCLYRIHYDSSVFSIRLFVNSGLPYSKREILTWSLDRIPELFPGKEEQILKAPALLGPTTKESPLGESQTVFSVTLPIEHHSDYDSLVAVVCIDVTQDHLLTLMKTSDFSKEGEVFLTDESGKALIGYSNFLQTPLSADELKNFSASREGSQTQLDGDLISISPLIWNNYHLVVVSPLDLWNQADHILLQLFLFGTLIGIAIYILASYYSRSNARRIVELSTIAKKIQKGQLNVHCIVDRSDEIGDLQISFNEMIDKMKQMLDSQYQLGCHLKDQELKLLQTQIDPHFLYNTLDLIIWTAQNRPSDEVCDIVRNLSHYYRISLSNGQDVIPIEKELEHVTLYVGLQNKRFQNKIGLITCVDSEARNLSIPKLLLQPLVENSIIHGFNGTQETITINVSKIDSYYCIIVADDGIGISSDKLSRLRLKQELAFSEPFSEAAQNHYGLSNIQERIRNFYGPEAHMDFYSDLSNGTTVKIFFPAN